MIGIICRILLFIEHLFTPMLLYVSITLFFTETGIGSDIKSMEMVLIAVTIASFVYPFVAKHFYRIPILDVVIKIIDGISMAFLPFALLFDNIPGLKDNIEVGGIIAFIIYLLIAIISTIPLNFLIVQGAVYESTAHDRKVENNVQNYINETWQQNIIRVTNIENRINQLTTAGYVIGMTDMEYVRSYAQFCIDYKNNNPLWIDFDDMQMLIKQIDNIEINVNNLINKYQQTYNQQYQQQTYNQQSYNQQQSHSQQSMNFFAGCNTKEDVEKCYRNLAKIYHPDNSTGMNEMFQQVQREYQEKLKQFS